jgi:hypothetical protein
MVESRAREIVIKDVRRPIFLAFLEYLYTDHVNVDVETAMELFVAADRVANAIYDIQLIMTFFSMALID